MFIEPALSAEALARGTLCIVADGMGGHADGEMASHLAVGVVRTHYYRSDCEYILDALRGAIETANDEIWRAARSDSSHAGMGCTLTALVIHGNDLVVGHVGDSRAYLIRRDAIAQITTDHSWVAEQVALGVLTPEEALSHPDRNVILRALGQTPSLSVDVYQERVEAGDILAICTDGLTTVVSDEEIGQLANELAPANAVRALIDLANQRGAPDNVTVVIMRVGPIRHGRASMVLRHWRPLLLVILTMLAGVAFVIAAALRGEPSRSRSEPPGPVGSTPIPTLTQLIQTPVAQLTAASTAVSTLSSVRVAPLPQDGYISSSDGAYLRSEPRVVANTESALLPYGARVEILGADSDGQRVDGSSLWYKVRVLPSGEVGFVHSSVVRLPEQTPTLPPDP